MLTQVGWYCAGGHVDHDGKMVTEPNIRLDDPCVQGVPVYTLNIVPAPPTEEDLPGFTVHKIAMPHMPDRVDGIGVRCRFCSVRLDNSTRGERCPNR